MVVYRLAQVGFRCTETNERPAAHAFAFIATLVPKGKGKAGTAKQVGGTAKLKDDRHQGMLMLELLKAIVPNKYANNPTILAEWLTASHVERPSHHKQTAPAQPTP